MLELVKLQLQKRQTQISCRKCLDEWLYDPNYKEGDYFDDQKFEHGLCFDCLSDIKIQNFSLKESNALIEQGKM